MPWLDIIWTGENEAHVIDAGLSVADVEYVLRNPIGGGVSRSSGRPFTVGETSDGRNALVVYEEIDAITVYPITAYVLED